MIDNANSQMLNLLKDVLHGRTPEPINEWNKVLEELNYQACTSVPADYVDALQIPNDAEYKNSVYNSVLRFYQIMDAQQDVLEVLNVPVVVLKGAAAAVNYPVSDYRRMGDIDLLVKPEDFEKAYNCLIKAGYKNNESLNKLNRHISFKKDEVSIELHHHFSNATMTNPEWLDECLYKGIDNRVIEEINEYEFPVLPSMENGLVYLTHIYQHLEEGLGLRQIIDWMCYVEKYLDNDAWEEFAVIAEKIGMKTLAEVVTGLCSKYLGLDSSITWFKCDDAVVDQLLEYIIRHGNFGKKNEVDNRAVVVYRWVKNPITAFKYAQELGSRNWKLLDKFPFLSPFAWIYQFFRWFVRSIKRGVTLSTIKEASTKEVKDSQLLYSLGIKTK